MDNRALQFVQVISNLPSDVNPYVAVAKILETSIHPPRSPSWSRYLTIALLVFTELLLFQSVFLLYQRLQISKQPKIKFNNLGLLIVNISYVASFSYFFYSAATVYTLLVQVTFDLERRVDQSKRLLVYGLKFVPVILGAWAFVWVCACQTAKIFWNSDAAMRLSRGLLKNLISWGQSIFFIFIAFGPLPSIAWKYIEAYKSLREIETIAHNISSTLLSKAESYDSLQSNHMSILPLIAPAMKILPLRDNLEDCIRHGQKIYLSVLCILSLIYIPFLTISLRGLYKQSVSQASIDAATKGSDSKPKRSLVSQSIHRQRQRLVWHAVCAYFATSTHLPALIYGDFLSRSPGFTQNLKWHLVTFQGLTIPLAFTGNVVLAILNLHAYLILQDRSRAQRAKIDFSITDSEDKSLWQKAVNFAREFISFSNDDALELENLEENDKGELRLF